MRYGSLKIQERIRQSTYLIMYFRYKSQITESTLGDCLNRTHEGLRKNCNVIERSVERRKEATDTIQRVKQMCNTGDG